MLDSMKPQRLISCVVCLGFILAILSANANEQFLNPYPKYRELKHQLDHLRTKNQWLILQVEAIKGRKFQNLSFRQKKIISEHNHLKNELAFWEPAAKLKQALTKTYTNVYKNKKVSHELDAETSLLSIELIQEIRRLQKEYKIHSFPTVHNFLILLHYKKRGACKHWAEDLLLKLESIPRNYFDIYWGEAFPGKLFEHNVAVLVPKGASFEQGIMIDPWRTAGKPFWLPIKDDHFYKWQAWSPYAPR